MICTWRVPTGVRMGRDSSGMMTCSANSPAADNAARHPLCLRWLCLRRYMAINLLVKHHRSSAARAFTTKNNIRFCFLCQHKLCRSTLCAQTAFARQSSVIVDRYIRHGQHTTHSVLRHGASLKKQEWSALGVACGGVGGTL